MGEKRVIEQIASDEIYNDDWFLKDSVLHDTTKVQPSVLKAYFNQGMATSQDLTDEATARQNMDNQLASGIGQQMSNLADFYDTTKSYVVGDVCVLQSGELMRCTSPTSGTFDNTKWEQVTVDELFDDLNFNAEAISYDNTSSGLEADNVQDAIGETITKLSAVGSASGDIATFTDGSDLPMPKLEVGIEPQQDLHGYDAPWVGGAGKNKFDGTATLDNKWINANGEVESQYGFWTSDYIPVKQGDIVRRTATGSGRGAFFDINKENGVYSSGTELTASQDGYYRFCGDKSTILPTGQVVCTINNTDLTYAPYSNICQISGWDEVNVTRTGKNLFDKTTITENKIINNNTGEETTSYGRFSSDYIKVNPSTDYYASNVIKSAQWYCTFYYDKNKNYLSCGELSSTGDIASGVITTPSNCNYVRLVSLTTYKDDVSFVVGNQAPTTYEPYNGQTYTLDLDGTRYGGKVDLVSGVMTVDRVSITVDENSNIISGSGGLPFRIDLLTGAKTSSSASALTGVKCNFLKEVTQSSSWGVDGTFSRVTTDAKIVYFKVDSEITTIQQLKTFLQSNNLQFVYELATPLTIQLTPTVVKSLRGVNNVWGDCGEVLDAEYIRDLTTIIDYILEQLGN